jgi:hypothetical protein
MVRRGESLQGKENVMFVFVENLGYYNEGYRVGGWILLGKSEEELQLFLEEVVCIDEAHEEYFISDTESHKLCYSVNPYCDLFELNHLVCEFNQLTEEEQMTIHALLETGIVDNLTGALDMLDNYQLLSGIKNEYDLGYYFLEDFNFYEIPEFIQNYIDYERYGQDLLISGDGYLTAYGFLMSA